MALPPTSKPFSMQMPAPTMVAHERDQTQHRAALGEEVIDEQNAIVRAEEAGGNDDVVVALMGEGGDLRGQDFTVDVARLCFLGEYHRNTKMLRGDACDSDAGSLDGQDFGDAAVTEAAEELLAQFIDQRNVHLMIEESVDLEHIAVLDAAAFQNGIFQ